MKRFILGLLCCCFCAATVLSMTACQSEVSEADSGASSSATSDSAKDQKEAMTEIKLGELTLKYPEKWKDSVQVKVTETTAAFSSKDQKLFDIIIGDSDEYLLGTTADGISVHLKTYEVKDDDELLAMQEDSNVILNNLIKDYQLSTDNDKPTEPPCFAIETSVVTLYYPEKWKDEVTVAENDGAVTFSCGDTDLFAILFNSDDGYLLGTYDGVALSLVNYEVTEEKHMMMQEASNDVLQHLYEDKKFNSAN